MLLAGDIGGTKTVLALFAVQDDEPSEIDRRPILERTYPSTQYKSLETMVETFLAESGEKVTAASFGVAGPVVGTRAQVTNLPWVIDAEVIQEQFQFPVHLLNDLQAVAAAVPYLKDADLFTLNVGEPVPGAAMAVIAPGTGLGEAFLVWDGRQYLASPSEGGHKAFGPMTAEQLEMLNYWLPRMGHVSYERVCSGIGIPNIYTFLRETGRYPEPEWLREELSGAADQTPIIARAAMTNEAPIGVATLEMFMEILGNEAANLALTVLATGGVYIGGGIPPRILPQLQKGPFMKYFCDKGRFSSLMSKIPVHVIANAKTGLYGTAYSALHSAVIDNVLTDQAHD